MTRRAKLLAKILRNPNDVAFRDLIVLVEAFGFRCERVSGSHHIFAHPAVPELVNLQTVHGKAKAYQVRQFLRLVEKYDLRLDGEG